jgi:MHS family proline/betaine transporter-like MFS transporter
MYGIALSTIVIGMTPSYVTIGSWALVIVMTAKTIQLACFGGEYNGAGIYVVEHAPQKQEALMGSLLTSVMLSGSLVASLMGVVLTYPSMPVWSWRIAFIFGGLIGVAGIFYRKNLIESPHFVPANLESNGLMALMKQFPQELLAGFFIGGLATAPFSTVLLFIMPVLATQGFLTNHQLMWIESFLIFFAMMTFIPVGIIADKKSPGAVMRFSCLLLIAFSYPLISIVDKGNLFLTMMAMTGIIIINEIFLGPSNAYLKNIFPMQYRYRGASLSFCIGMSLIGGTTPIIENYLYKSSGRFSVAALWLILLGVGALFSLEQVRRKNSTSSVLPVLTG